MNQKGVIESPAPRSPMNISTISIDGGNPRKMIRK
jgi:hypothetical protein